jgi:hypothetical protein
VGTQRKTFVADYERAGERLVAVCSGCQRTAVLSYRELNRRAKHMLTLAELARFLRCRNCKKKVAAVRVATSFSRPPPNRH